MSVYNSLCSSVHPTHGDADDQCAEILVHITAVPSHHLVMPQRKENISERHSLDEDFIKVGDTRNLFSIHWSFYCFYLLKFVSKIFFFVCFLFFWITDSTFLCLEGKLSD